MVVLCTNSSESLLMSLMSLEMWDCNSTLSFLESVCWVVNQLVNHLYLNLLLVLISFQEVMVLLQEDLWNWDLIIRLIILNHGLSLKKSLIRNSLTSLKSNKRLISWQIRYVVKVKTLSTNQSCWQFTLILVQILHLLISQVLLESQCRARINQTTLNRSPEQWQTDTCLIPEQSFFVSFQLMLIWPPQTVYKWQESLIQKVSELLV